MRFTHFLLGVLIVITWGLNFVAMQIGLDNMPPFFLAFCRFFLSSIPLVFFVKKPDIPWKYIGAYGLSMFFIQFALLLSGMKAGVTPDLAGIIMQVQVLFSSLIAWFVFREKIEPWQLIGGIVAFSGICFIGVKINGDISTIGFLFVVGAASAWSCGNALTRKLQNASPVGLVVYGSLLAWPPLLLLTCLVEGPHQIWDSLQNINISAIGTLLYLSYVTVIFSFIAWSFLIKTYSLLTIVPFSFFIPIIAMFSAALILKEPLPYWKMVAASVVLLGLVIEFIGKRFFSKKNKL